MTSTRTQIAMIVIIAIGLLISLAAIGLTINQITQSEADKEDKNVDENIRLISEFESNISQIFAFIETNGMRDTLAENFKLMSELESKINRTRIDIDKTLGMRNVVLKADGWYSATNELFYKRFHRRMTYNDSEAECERHGAQLVAEALRRPAEIKHMLEQGLLPKTGIVDIWIGYTDIEEEDVWEWVDGVETNDATVQWTPGNPNNYDSEEHCGEINMMRGNIVLINDAVCDETVPSFICEILLTSTLT